MTTPASPAVGEDGLDRAGGSCLAQIRRLVLTGRLLPGQKVNQGEIAARLGVSRVPVREALAALRSEGLMESRANTGFTVVRPTVDDLVEIYLMRNLLESELLRSVDLATVDVELLERVNGEMARLDPVVSFDEYRLANERFHFAIFDRSPLRLVRREVGRLWTLSEFYRSIYIHGEGAHGRVIEDHASIIDAVRRRDHEALVAVSTEHRGETEISMSRVLGRRAGG
ncbi:GntR family transcriptional regulator [Actinomadura viridis]|uniref:DNA-binding GntR family transcriptional regulator n=1 Tax=Actinomadura viridis TaxID=58110 RepID=A0A931GRP8_9ACTN|nr:GntR family transcriptional regulator [Actinomadura viridis]MBG6093081.1 DNA-binding GntR family transcriptional regulator [Actinomadura viridis]